MRRLALACLVPLAACSSSGGRPPATAVAPVCAPANDSLIVPGCRIGPYALGLTEAELLKRFGVPTKTEGSKRAASGAEVADHEYENGAVSVRTVNGVVRSLISFSARFATAEGVKVGATELEARALLGKPSWTNRDIVHNRLCFKGPSGSSSGIHVVVYNRDGPNAGRIISIGIETCRP